MRFEQALEIYTPNFAAELPDHIPVERFKRTIITALNQNPDLRKADRRSLFNACVKCAHDGLYPDGREAALTVFNTKTKVDGEDVRVPTVQYLPMIQGIRKRMRNSGEVLSATAEVVHRNDHFHYWHGENPGIEHEPPPLGQDRGPAVGAYAIIKLANGEVLRDVMSTGDIEKARSKSRSPDSLMWRDFWGEGAKKTVLRRCSKQAPTNSELERLLNRDDEQEMPPAASHAQLPPPRPTRDQFVEHEPDQPYCFTGLDGEILEFEKPEQAVDKLEEILAQQTAIDAVAALWENAEALRHTLEGTQVLVALTDAFRDRNRALGGGTQPQKRTRRTKTPGPATESSTSQEKGDGTEVQADHDGAGGKTATTKEPAREPSSMEQTAAEDDERELETDEAEEENQARDIARGENLHGTAPPPNRPAMRDGASKALPMLHREGRPFPEAWVKIRLLPEIRKETDAVELAYLCGDNEAAIMALPPDLRALVDKERAAAFDRIAGSGT